MKLHCNVYTTATTDYLLSLLLRHKILRIPLKIDFTASELEKDKDDFHIGIFDQNEILLGCMILSPEKNNKVKMRQVAVDNHLQGKGIGSELLQFAEDFAKSQGFTYIHCNARKEAVPFYLKNGYRISGDAFLEVGIPHVYMSKTLGS